jgi:formate hydrogenlyase subunit 3/multisubunit Na+/H+ antiporter MnhD subunit
MLGMADQASSLGSLPLLGVVPDDVHVTNRISALISAFGVLASVMVLVLSIGQYRSGASTLWLVAGVVIVLAALYALVQDIRRLRTEPTA